MFDYTINTILFQIHNSIFVILVSFIKIRHTFSLQYELTKELVNGIQEQI